MQQIIYRWNPGISWHYKRYGYLYIDLLSHESSKQDWDILYKMGCIQETFMLILTTLIVSFNLMKFQTRPIWDIIMLYSNTPSISYE